jgi:type II secretory pathway component GspD/PulD (secretin)
MLLQTDQARIMARPYMAAISGYQAKIDVAEDRYVTTFTENSGDVTLEPVTSGVTMTITPFLLPDEQIRMDLQVSVSQFVPTLDNVQLARSRSDASSTMRIASGETLVIGGLMAAQAAKSIVGVPGARSVPGLGFLFGERKDSDLKRQLLVYITPYVWEPGMATPNDAAGNLRSFLDTQSLYPSND